MDKSPKPIQSSDYGLTSKSASNTTSNRSINRILYFILNLVFIGTFLYVFSFIKPWAEFNFYTIVEYISSVVAIIIAAMALIKYITRRNNKYLYIGFGFGVAATYHFLFAINLSEDHSLVDKFIDSAWITEYLILSVYFTVSWGYWFLRSKLNPKSNTKHNIIVSLSILIILVILMLFSQYKIFFHSIILFLLCVSLTGYLHKRQWKKKYFEHWFTMALMIMVASHIVYMISDGPFSTNFFAAYILKLLSYSFIVIGLLMSIYLAFTEVEEGKDKVNAILTSIGDGVFVVDKNSHIIIMNDAAKQLSGYSIAEAYGQHYQKIFKFSKEKENSEDLHLEIVKKVLNTGITQKIGVGAQLTNKEGEIISISDSAAPIKDANGIIVGCVVVFHNITRQRELERTKDNFLSVAAHQLRTPLGAMRWNLEMIINGDSGKINNIASKQLKQIYESNQRMIGLVNDLLNVSRIDQRRVADHPVNLSLIKLISDIVNEIKVETFKKKITINFNPDLIDPFTLLIDESRIRQTLQNLISNAIKYNRLNGSVTIKLESKNDFYYISISDTGMGIPKKDHQGIFSKFYRASNAVQSIADGTGLGLFVVQSYVKGWGGTISFDSIEGVGTSFFINLPKKPSSNTMTSNLENKPQTVS